MPRARDLLARFRPAGTPGAAAPAGVPADRVAEAQRELEPVFAALADVRAEADRIRAEAAAEAARRRERAATEADRIRASARLDAEGRRAEAAARVGRRRAREMEAVTATAERAAADIGRRARGRMAGYVERVVNGVVEEVLGSGVDKPEGGRG
jgi:hypothetical protein